MIKMYDLNEIKKDEINKAYLTSKKILKNAYSNGGINAGETHFSDVWLRILVLPHGGLRIRRL